MDIIDHVVDAKNNLHNHHKYMNIRKSRPLLIFKSRIELGSYNNEWYKRHLQVDVKWITKHTIMVKKDGGKIHSNWHDV